MSRFILHMIFITPVKILAQEYVMITDRPDITESALIVPSGILQAEHGFQYNSLGNMDGIVSIPTLLRFGVGGNTEFRATFQPIISPTEGEHQDGLLPVTVGLKVGLADEDRFLPQMALLAQIELATFSSPGLRDSYTGLSVIWLGSYDIPGALAFGYNLGIQYDGTNEQPVYPYSLSVGISLADKLAFFAEHYATVTKNEFHKNADAGFTWLLRPHMQIDCSAGYSWETNNYFAGLGYSWFISTGNK